MRILIIDPNGDPEMTRAIQEAAERFAGDDHPTPDKEALAQKYHIQNLLVSVRTPR